MKPVNIKEFRNKHTGKAWGQLFQVVTIICTWSEVFHHQRNCLTVLIQVQRETREGGCPSLHFCSQRWRDSCRWGNWEWGLDPGGGREIKLGKNPGQEVSQQGGHVDFRSKVRGRDALYRHLQEFYSRDLGAAILVRRVVWSYVYIVQCIDKVNS